MGGWLLYFVGGVEIAFVVLIMIMDYRLKYPNSTSLAREGSQEGLCRAGVHYRSCGLLGGLKGR